LQSSSAALPSVCAQGHLTVRHLAAFVYIIFTRSKHTRSKHY